MQDTVGHFDPSSKELGEALIKADYHGAILKVIRATCVTRVGLSGIVIMETQETFKIVTLDNLLKVIPKKNTVFTFELQYIRSGKSKKYEAQPPQKQKQKQKQGKRKQSEFNPFEIKKQESLIPSHGILVKLTITLYGDQIRYRAAERTHKKFKAKPTIEIR